MSKKANKTKKQRNNSSTKESLRSEKAKKILRIIGLVMASAALIAGSIWVGSAIKKNRQEKCEHSWDKGKAIVAATCTDGGEYEFTCVKCDFKKTEAVAALGHTQATVAAVPATCLETGLTDGIKCSTCNAVIVEQGVVPALGHKPVVDKAVPATCTGTGLTEGTHCSRCAAVLTAQTPTSAKGHTLETVLGKMATCSMPGLTDGTKCKTCGAVYAAQETIEALGHNFTVIEAQAPTCSLIGWNEYVKCERDNCGYTTYVEIPALGHTYENDVCTTCGFTLEGHTHVYQYSRVTQEATCATVGIITYTCECGDEQTEEVAKLSHVYDSGVITTAATCTENGVKTYSCLNCGDTKTEVVLATGHNMNIGNVTIPATCTEKGVKTYSCLNCDYATTEDIAALGHNMDGGKVIEAATCTTNGESRNTCLTCGYYTVDTVEATGHEMSGSRVTIPATCETNGESRNSCLNCDYAETETIYSTGHKYGEDVVISLATCTEDGAKTKTCEYCGDVVRTTLPALGHNFDSGKVEKAATCTTDGKLVATCQECGGTETKTLFAYGHDFEVTQMVSATCTEKGYIVEKCRVCAMETIATSPAISHNYVDNVCTMCGESVRLVNQNLRMTYIQPGEIVLRENSKAVEWKAMVKKTELEAVKSDTNKTMCILLVDAEKIRALGASNTNDWFYLLNSKYGSKGYYLYEISDSQITVGSGDYAEISILRGMNYIDMNTKYIALPCIQTRVGQKLYFEYADITGYEEFATTATNLVHAQLNYNAYKQGGHLSEEETSVAMALFNAAIDHYYGESEPTGAKYEFDISFNQSSINLKKGEKTTLKIQISQNLLDWLGIGMSSIYVVSGDESKVKVYHDSKGNVEVTALDSTILSKKIPVSIYFGGKRYDACKVDISVL